MFTVNSNCIKWNFFNTQVTTKTQIIIKKSKLCSMTLITKNAGISISKYDQQPYEMKFFNTRDKSTYSQEIQTLLSDIIVNQTQIVI